MVDPPETRPYEPFPSFTAWAESASPHPSFDALAEAFSTLHDQYGSEELKKAIIVATKWAAIDTGAIEGLYEIERGLTFTIALNTTAWDNLHQMKGASVAESIRDAMAGYELVLDVATSKRPITEAWIRSLHERICASQATHVVYTDNGPQDRQLALGTYKTDPNSPLNLSSMSIHSYASPLDTAPEMQRLVDELNSSAFLAAHPVVQSSYAHYAFVAVHPFADGNGRVSRALASTFLYRLPGVPLVIFADQKPEYIDVLERADGGNFQPFANFIGERAIDTMGMVRTVLANATKPSISEQVQLAQEMLVGRAGLTHPEFDALGTRMLESFSSILDRVIIEAALTRPLTAKVRRSSGSVQRVPEGFRTIPNSQVTLTLSVTSGPPFNAKAEKHYQVVVARPGANVSDFMILSPSGGAIEADVRELSPSISPPLEFRLHTTATGDLGQLLSRVISDAEKKLRAQGYT